MESSKRNRRSKREEPLLEARLARMQQLLRLGMRIRQDGSSRWSSPDAGVQLQALRAISETIESFSSNASSSPSFKDMLQALEDLLQVKNEQVSTKAAVICAALANTRSSSLTCLVPPLARLLSTNSLSGSAAVALVLIVSNLNSVQQRSVMTAIEDAGSLDTITRVVEEGCSDTEVLASYVELLAIILENLPLQRYAVVGCRGTIRSVLLELACSSIHRLAAASLRGLSSSCTCSDVARLVAQEKQPVAALFQSCLSSSRPSSIKTESFHFLNCLAKFSTYFSGGESHIDVVATACVETLRTETRSSLEAEQLLLVATYATSALLSSRGKHRLQLISAGIVATFGALLPKSKSGIKNWRLNLHGSIYESIGWIGCLCSKEEEALLLGDRNSAFKELIDHLCCAFLGAVVRKGRKYEFLPGVECEQDSLELTSQEVVHICRAVAQLVSSPSEQCSSCTLRSLEHHLKAYKDWSMTLLVDSLHLTCSSRVLPDKAETLARLYALSTGLHLPTLRQGLDKTRTLEALVNILKRHQGLQDVSPRWRSFRVLKPCCSQGTQDWSGSNDLLFATVSTLGEFLIHTTEFNSIRESLEEEHVQSVLRTLASDKTCADGVRWWASVGLACYGYCETPNSFNKDLSKLRDDPSLADISFLFPDGRSLSVHGAVLAARCPKLLPGKPLQQTDFGEMQVVRISSRITYRACNSTLDYLYAGFVRLQADELLEVKALAKRCHLDSLLILLNRKAPVWGRCIDTGSLEPALSQYSTDIVLRCSSSSQSTSGCIQAHRAILSARCDYFQAAFRSGMRESFANILEVPVRSEVISRFVHYIYTNELEGSSWGCSWNHLHEEKQLDILEQLMELAGVSQQWLQDDLREECLQAIGKLKASVLVCPRVMQQAYARKQWDVVLATAESMAPDYPKLRDMGALDCLDDELADLVRTSYVKLSLQDLR